MKIMVKNKKQLSVIFCSCQALLLFIQIILPGSLFAISDESFYKKNDINFLGSDSECTVAPTGDQNRAKSNLIEVSNNKDYKGRQIISDSQLSTIKNNQSVYEEAANQSGLPWQLYAVIHIRESNLADFNPGNGQGIYQDYGFLRNNGNPYPPNGGRSVGRQEFLRQTINLTIDIKEKSGSKFDLLKKADPDAIKDVLFGYNGRAAVYVEQAKKLGFDDAYEGSPYVMNKADEKRDPTVQGSNGTWGQIASDGGSIAYPAGGDYGGYVLYVALAGIPSSSSANKACSGLTTPGKAGPNGWSLKDMQIYYQIEEPWASTMVNGYDLRDYGCGPTSTAMVIASLTGDKSVTPKTMAEFFASQVDGEGNRGFGYKGTYFFVFDAVAKKYNVSIESLPIDMSKVEEAIKRGSLVIVSANTAPLAPIGGHILVIRGLSSKYPGQFLVANPANHDHTNSEDGFTYSQVLASTITGFWEVRKN